jgi:hypothetical protein
LNCKFVSTDRSASQISNPGVTPEFLVERTDDADVRYWHLADMAIAPPMSAFGGEADIDA